LSSNILGTSTFAHTRFREHRCAIAVQPSMSTLPLLASVSGLLPASQATTPIPRHGRSVLPQWAFIRLQEK